MLRLLILRSPDPVLDDELRCACLERPAYRKRARESHSRTLDNYVSRLRCCLGAEVGGRILRVHGSGYAYLPPTRLGDRRSSADPASKSAP